MREMDEAQLVAVAAGDAVVEVAHDLDAVGTVGGADLHDLDGLGQPHIPKDEAVLPRRHEQVLGQHHQVRTVRASDLK